jgi:two-component system, chemotaxis family, sensor kinase CheA
VDQQKMLALFLSEGRELLMQVDAELLTLERAPTTRAALDAVFRAVHSLKGMAATVGLAGIERGLHSGESLLDAARDVGQLDPTHLDALLQLSDVLRPAFDAAERGAESPPALDAICARLEALAPQASARTKAPARVSAAAVVETVAAAAGAQWRVDVRIAGEAALPSARATIVVKRLSAIVPLLRMVPDAEAQADPAWDRAFTLWLGSGSDAEQLERAVRGAGDVAECQIARDVVATTNDRSDSNAERTVRVPVSRLDELLDRIGELVLVRDRLLREVPASDDTPVRAAIDEASRLITQLRDAILTSRMVPLAEVFDRFPRHVRDTSVQLGKDIDLIIEGRELEVDRSLLNELSEPLLHLLRNAVDHGLESPADRIAAGKPARGRLAVRAARDGAMLAVTVADDGRGVNRERVVASARSQGVHDADALANSDHGLLQLMARPGLSTAAAVTSISGRGVGVDAVQHRVQSIGGRLDLSTDTGIGTAVTLRLPLSVAILRALLVRVAGETYAVPLARVHATRLARDGATRADAQGRRFTELDGETLPLVCLRAHLGLPQADDVAGHLVVLEGAGGRLALHVDVCATQHEIVVKPLQRVRGAAALFSGGTILPDGTPSLILDINTLS